MRQEYVLSNALATETGLSRREHRVGAARGTGTRRRPTEVAARNTRCAITSVHGKTQKPTHPPTTPTEPRCPSWSCLATCSVLKASGLQDSPGSLSGGPSTDHVLEHPLRVSLCFVQSPQLCLSDLVPPSATLSFLGWPVTCCLVFLCLQQTSVGTAA